MTVKYHFHFAALHAQHGPLGAATLEDNVDAIIWQMKDLGHTVTRYDQGDKGMLSGDNVINVIFEAFNENTARWVLANKAEGAKIACIVTENPTGMTWNGINQGKAGERMVDRMRWFKHLLDRGAFAALWHFVPHADDQLRKVHGNIAHLEIGWSDLRDAEIERNWQAMGWVRGDPDNPLTATVDRHTFGYAPGEPLHPYGFFGGATPRRKEMLAQLETLTGAKVHTLSIGAQIDKHTGQYTVDAGKALQTDYAPRDVRDRTMSNARVLIGPAAFARWGIFSASRGLTCILLRRAHVAEQTEPSVWHEILGDGYAGRFGKKFLERCRDMLPYWHQLAALQRKRCKELLPAHKTIGPVIDKTVAPLFASNVIHFTPKAAASAALADAA